MYLNVFSFPSKIWYDWFMAEHSCDLGTHGDARQQSRETTLEEAKRIFGPELQHLYQERLAMPWAMSGSWLGALPWWLPTNVS